MAILVPFLAAGAREQRQKSCKRNGVERQGRGHKHRAIDVNCQGINFAERGQGQCGHARLQGRWASALGLRFCHMRKYKVSWRVRHVTCGNQLCDIRIMLYVPRFPRKLIFERRPQNACSDPRAVGAALRRRLWRGTHAPPPYRLQHILWFESCAVMLCRSISFRAHPGFL